MTFVRKPKIRTASPILQSIFMEMVNRNMNQTTMADLLRTHQTRVSEWSAGKIVPGVMTVEAMANHLGYRLVLEELESPHEEKSTNH